MSTLRLPGLIDPHVHLREPGGTHKETFDSGTRAALAGGITCVLAMPNTQPPLIDDEGLALAERAAAARARCDYGLYLGASQSNIESAPALAARTCGMKFYLDVTFGPLLIPDLHTVRAHFARWPKERVIACHAEGRNVAAVILCAQLENRSVHICHVSRREEIELIRDAKERGLAVTCEVCPHHLFLTLDDAPRLGPGRCEVRPMLATADDVAALWQNMAYIDCIATDHAPHTLAEKDGPTPPPGYPGLETSLSLMLTAVHDGRLALEEVVTRMYDRPRQIFGLPAQPQTWIEVDTELAWQPRGAEMQSRCAWTPYEGQPLRGRVVRVVLRGEAAYEYGTFHAAPGSGRNIAQAALAAAAERETLHP
jgi:carbamoyl-phosphate synthase/aspartate carbamoyltransferase/dihydroorotase